MLQENLKGQSFRRYEVSQRYDKEKQAERKTDCLHGDTTVSNTLLKTRYINL